MGIGAACTTESMYVPIADSFVLHALQVMAVTLANEARCEEFRQQFLRFDFLWKTDLNTTLKVSTNRGHTAGTSAHHAICRIRAPLHCFSYGLPPQPHQPQT